MHIKFVHILIFLVYYSLNFYAKRINTNKEVAEEKAPFEGELDFDVYATAISLVLIRFA